MVTCRPFAPALRLSSRPGATAAALATLIDGDTDELQILLEIQAKTDPLARAVLGGLATLGPSQSYVGTGAAAVMMPFLLMSVSRFSAGAFGMLYGADSAETAVAEVGYHQTKFLRAANAPSGTSVLLSLWEFTVSQDLVDVRDFDASIYHADNYGDAQVLGKTIRDAGAAGILYRSVRRKDAECIGILKPRAVDRMKKRDDWRFVWDGAQISETLRVA